MLLCTLFSLLAFIDWIRGRAWVSVAWFALALLSKEECASLPLVLGLYSLLEGKLRGHLVYLAAMLVLALAAGLRVIAAIQQDGTCWAGATTYRGRTAMRISVSSWVTTEEDVERSLAAMIRVAATVGRQP